MQCNIASLSSNARRVHAWSYFCRTGAQNTSTVRQVLKLTEPPECFARLIVLLLYRWAYGLVFLKAAAERVSETKADELRRFIPWSCGSWKFGPMP